MIPADTPVSNRIFVDMPNRLGILVSDWLWLCGMSHGRWGKILADARHPATADLPLPMPFLAILARWMSRHPDASPTLRGPKPDDLFRRIGMALGEEFNQRQFGVGLGYDDSTGYRWNHGIDRPSRGPLHAMSMIDSGDNGTLAGNWRRWRDLALIEATARGIPDLMRRRGWRAAAESRRRDRRCSRRRRSTL